MTHEELIDKVSEAVREGSLELLRPFLAPDFIFRSEWILGDPSNFEESCEWLDGYLSRYKGTVMLKVISPYTGLSWLRFSENPKSSVMGLLEENGKIRILVLCSQICDKQR